jgi:ABC-2 type transport system ATP-binding protein
VNSAVEIRDLHVVRGPHTVLEHLNLTAGLTAA